MNLGGLSVSVLFLTGLAGSAGPQAPDPFRISVNVNLVVLNPTVRDSKGQFVSDLPEQGFEVYEDGVRQAIKLFRYEDIPVTVGLVIDHSGSMRHKLADVVVAARTFVHASRPDDQMFVVNFNEKVNLGLPVDQPFSNRSAELELAISTTATTGMTALYDAVFEGQRQLQLGSREKKVLIVISDGGDNASRHRLDEILKIAERSSAIVYTVGIFDPADPDQNSDVLRRLARATGGEAFLPRQPDEVATVCEAIARDIRHQYTIGYFSGNTNRSAAYRSLRVVARAKGSKLVVRTRSGYIAGEARASKEGPVR